MSMKDFTQEAGKHQGKLSIQNWCFYFLQSQDCRDGYYSSDTASPRRRHRPKPPQHSLFPKPKDTETPNASSELSCSGQSGYIYIKATFNSRTSVMQFPCRQHLAETISMAGEGHVHQLQRGSLPQVTPRHHLSTSFSSPAWVDKGTRANMGYGGEERTVLHSFGVFLPGKCTLPTALQQSVPGLFKHNSIQRLVKVTKTTHPVCVAVHEALFLGSPKYF